MQLKHWVINNFVDSAYCVGYRLSNTTLWDEKHSEYRILKPSVRYWYADPIPCTICGATYVFMEQFDRMKQRGYLAVAKLDNGGRISRPRTIIRVKTHLSFPMIIPFKGHHYMIPESSETKNIEIYQMKENVYEWEHYYSIKLDEEIVDIAYEVVGDSILLLGGSKAEKPLYVKRKIFQLNHLDDRNSIELYNCYLDENESLKVRNAGNFWVKNGKKYIISQESTEKDYGLYLLLDEVLEFSASSIKTRLADKRTVENIEISELNPMLCRKIGIHTYGQCGKLEVIDVAITMFSLYPILRKMIYILKRFGKNK